MALEISPQKCEDIPGAVCIKGCCDPTLKAEGKCNSNNCALGKCVPGLCPGDKSVVCCVPADQLTSLDVIKESPKPKPKPKPAQSQAQPEPPKSTELPTADEPNLLTYAGLSIVGGVIAGALLWKVLK